MLWSAFTVVGGRQGLRGGWEKQMGLFFFLPVASPMAIRLCRGEKRISGMTVAIVEFSVLGGRHAGLFFKGRIEGGL